MNIGAKITEARRQRGITQSEIAVQMCVTRQTVSRWEAGTALPDVEKVACIAKILQVSCDYLLKDDCNIENSDTFVQGGVPADENNLTCTQGAGVITEVKSAVTELLQALVGKKVTISFCEGELDFEMIGEPYRVEGFEGNWIKLQSIKGKESKQKLIALSSIKSFEILEEERQG